MDIYKDIKTLYTYKVWQTCKDYISVSDFHESDTVFSKDMKAMELQGERLELFNEIINLDTESIEKVKKYIKRIASNRYKISRTTQVDDIDIITDEEIENAMRPLSYEEKIESLRLSEADPVYYTQEEMRKAVASWRNL